MRLTVGLESINSYQRLSYTTWHALAEFVDNSTQAYFDNRERLDAAYQREGGRLSVSIFFDRETGVITIRDTSIGMSKPELEEALRIAARPPRDGGRSRYGMGMKTAACWFGDLWSIKTKKLGESKVITVTVDVPTVAAGDGTLQSICEDGEPEEHGTEITIARLHRGLHGSNVRRVKEYLRSMYRCDLREDALELLVQGEPLSWEGFETRILLDSDGKPYRRDLNFQVLGKQVTGWVAVLESGGRPYAGFSLLQNNRVIRGYPDGWRPRSIFGQEEGSNDLVNQRLCGELHIDGFQVSHTKDDIAWQGEEEDKIEEKLAEECDHYRNVAKNRRKGDKRGPSQVALDNAVDQIRKELNSGEMVDAIEISEIPSEEVLRDVNKQSVQHAAKGKPRFDVRLGDMHVRLYVDADASPRDPYYVLDWKPDGAVEIAVNRNHDYMVQLGDDVADFIRQCVYDGIAEFKATQKKGRVEPNTIRFIKDNLLRVPYRLHDDAPDFEVDSTPV